MLYVAPRYSSSWRCVFLIAMALVLAETCFVASATDQKVVDCKEATLVRPGMGSAFSGTVKNDDYMFSARIPIGHTAWDGVAENSSFHGLAMFLDPQMKSCIVFEIHIRVDDSEAPKPLGASAPRRLGSTQGWQSTQRDEVSGASITNIRTLFSFKQRGQIDDGEVLFIAPTGDLSRTKTVYDAFLASLKFEP